MGVDAWGRESNFEITDLKHSIQGAASTVDMGVVYACKLLRCVVPVVFAGTREKLADSSVEKKCARIATASALSTS